MVGIYARLSREDDKSGISESIENQIKFLRDYAKKQKWSNIKIYIDDGYTGTNFDRPGFKKLISDIENKKIDTIITKDLSRLGRDYIDTGYYIEKYFPLKKIRYIAVNDGVDTIDEKNSNNEITPFKAVINDMYAKDISKKVKSALITKVINGENIKPFVPYGYKKKENQKIVIDDRVAANVKNIFKLYLSGKNKKEICRYLDNNNIITPAMYKMQYSNYKNPNKKTNKGWSTATITNILKDRTYIGDLVQHKYSSVNYKIKKVVKLDENEYIVIPNNHEPIISENEYNKVQEMLKSKANECKRQSKTLHVLTGLAVCEECGARLTYTKNHGNEFKIICSNYKKNGAKACKNIYINETEVIEKIKNNIIGDIRRKGIEKIEIESSKQAQINRIKDEIRRTKQVMQKIYEDREEGILDESTAIELISNYAKENKSRKLKIKALNSKMGKQTINVIEEIKKASEEEIRGLILKLISKITISKNRITIFYNYSQ